MKLQLAMVMLAGMIGEMVEAGPLPHNFVQNYTMHNHLVAMYPIDHPIWAARMGRMGERELKVCFLSGPGDGY